MNVNREYDGMNINCENGEMNLHYVNCEYVGMNVKTVG
jgi:hypothetical protein